MEIDRRLAGEASTSRNFLKGAYEASLAQEKEMRSRIETESGCPRPAEAQHPVQYSQARSRYQPGTLYDLLQRYKGGDDRVRR